MIIILQKCKKRRCNFLSVKSIIHEKKGRLGPYKQKVELFRLAMNEAMKMEQENFLNAGAYVRKGR